jgi:hypothetical protein
MWRANFEKAQRAAQETTARFSELISRGDVGKPASLLPDAFTLPRQGPGAPDQDARLRPPLQTSSLPSFKAEDVWMVPPDGVDGEQQPQGSSNKSGSECTKQLILWRRWELVWNTAHSMESASLCRELLQHWPFLHGWPPVFAMERKTRTCISQGLHFSALLPAPLKEIWLTFCTHCLARSGPATIDILLLAAPPQECPSPSLKFFPFPALLCNCPIMAQILLASAIMEKRPHYISSYSCLFSSLEPVLSCNSILSCFCSPCNSLHALGPVRCV